MVKEAEELKEDEEVKVYQTETLHSPIGIHNACVCITAAAAAAAL